MGAVQAVPASDAAYLKLAIQDWLVGAFTQTDTESYLVNTYASRYGTTALQNVLLQLNADSNLQILNAPAGATDLSQLQIDWRDYLRWRLNLEEDLKRQGNQEIFFTLYDTRDPQIQNLAISRFQQAPTDSVRNIMSVQLDSDAQGAPLLRSLVQVGEAQEIIEFRLADGVWKRIN
jgi:hypothetical protein